MQGPFQGQDIAVVSAVIALRGIFGTEELLRVEGQWCNRVSNILLRRVSQFKDIEIGWIGDQSQRPTGE